MTDFHSDNSIKITKDGYRHKGWRVITSKGPIIKNKHVDEFRGKLNNVMTVPEMLYDNNYVEFTHDATGIKLSFNSMDALLDWSNHQLPPVQVSESEAWKKARELEIQMQNAVQLEFDWTYTTPYTGSLIIPASLGNIGHHDHVPERSTGPSTSADSSNNAHNEDPDFPSAAWVETEVPLDKSLLMERDPIMFFDEVVLYESDLDDNGVSQLSIKLRVMPRCWLILLRFWMRVDNLMVRLRETRIFCRSDQPDSEHIVHRETRHYECMYEDLIRAFSSCSASASKPPSTLSTPSSTATPVPTSPSTSHCPAAQCAGPHPHPHSLQEAFANGDSASLFLNAASPQGLKFFKLEKLELLPLVRALEERKKTAKQ
uniref:TIP41-like protein n=1 Tax=Polytomella parva TaxID=51329 RepID=A0A6U0V0Z3_9CHLO|eukprot:CAMPEP_0175058490 /NCGR_PEP_ID=MMETSP0052_2-20121109/11875_1 /TAXON_ID=51329 ORGANISM="Polytomella parva, Strain SAG 63-3" /NCGR_SAMPLE_ID=MMETSP0052_2 /ASSEMBLY_ACC=CAM_ASM_000194 /LENGTH=371 /DNA_ID=CAMNT_0016323873 /DNA_START=37 /DNA_END=1152 /DNA_ORIENTATION=-